jgi:hypothetical protein
LIGSMFQSLYIPRNHFRTHEIDLNFGLKSGFEPLLYDIVYNEIAQVIDIGDNVEGGMTWDMSATSGDTE